MLGSGLQLFVLPMFFLSGAVFPPANLPAWLPLLTKVDPLSYVVDPRRRAVFSHDGLSEAARRSFSPGLHWGSWRLPAGFELALVAAVILTTLSIGAPVLEAGLNAPPAGFGGCSGQPGALS